jgi:hypothetical protein
MDVVHAITLDNGVEITQNFDWSVTNRQMCIFMPHHHDRKYTQFSIDQIRTSIPKNDYVIIVGCDNNKDEFEGDNVYYFWMKTPTQGSRNGCFIRNYAIKRCQSMYFLQKDGEVVILGDFIKNCFKKIIYHAGDSQSWTASWRAGKIYVLNDQQTRRYMSTKSPEHFISTPTEVIKENFPGTTNAVKDIIYNATGTNLSTFFHYAYCVPTLDLEKVRGYDERFGSYGYEDSDMFCRLYAMGHRLIPDPYCSAVHLCHPKNAQTSDITKMRKLFGNSDPETLIRNPSGWGDGIPR